MADAREIARIRGAIDALFADWTEVGVPGGAVGVLVDGQAALHRCYGLANVEHDVPVTPATRFHIASVTKHLVAAALVLLEADGKVDLDDPVAAHFPWLKAGRDARLRQLLDMTSGLRDTGELMRQRGVWFRYPRTHEDMLELLARQTTLNYPTGDRYIYTNINFGLAGTLIEQLTGQTLDDALRSLLFDPLGMNDTLVRDANTQLTKHLATGYIPDGDGFEVGVWSFGISGAGCLVSTIGDLLVWQAALLANKLRGVKVRQALRRTGALNDGTPLTYGLGLDTRLYRGVEVLSHGGSLPGYKAMFAFAPREELGFVLLANRDDAEPTTRYRQLLDILLEDRSTIAGPNFAVDDAVAATLEGRWFDAASGELLVIKRRADGGLDADKLGYGMVLEPEGAGRWCYRFGHFPITVELVGNDLELYFGGQRCRFERLGPPPSDVVLDDYAGTYMSDDLGAEHVAWVADGRLWLRQGPACHGASTFPLELLARDRFHLQGGKPGWPYHAALRFERDANGAVIALVVSTDRLKDLRLERA